MHTFEFHEDRAKQAADEFRAHGVEEWVTAKHADACKEGFGLEHVCDAVFLDLPKPWGAFATSKKALKVTGGRLCTFSPCIEQVQRSCEELAAMGFSDIRTFSCLERPYDVRSVVRVFSFFPLSFRRDQKLTIVNVCLCLFYFLLRSYLHMVPVNDCFGAKVSLLLARYNFDSIFFASNTITL